MQFVKEGKAKSAWLADRKFELTFGRYRIFCRNFRRVWYRLRNEYTDRSHINLEVQQMQFRSAN